MPNKPSVKICNDEVDEGVESVFKVESKANIREEHVQLSGFQVESTVKFCKAGFETVEEDIK